MKADYKIDIPVLIIFFCREQPLAQVFEQVRKAKPSKLYLYQDGARKDNPADMAKIKSCRKIVENIDWNCEVHRWYQEENKGCDPSEYLAQKWMFETEEYGIVLEDDDVPSQAFFPYCKELLERYKEDDRINSIMGRNNMGIYPNTNASYLFTHHGSIWGWASWKRVLDGWDPKYTWLDNPEKLKMLKKNSGFQFKEMIKAAKRHREEGVAYYETIFGAACWIHDRYNIIPKYNMISNVGQTEDATHGTADVRLCTKKTQKILRRKRYEIDFPLIHPEKIELHSDMEKFFVHQWGSKWEYYIRCLIYLPPKDILKKIRKKLEQN